MRKLYSVVTPDVVGIFTNWQDVKLLVTGVSKSCHKSFYIYDEAKQFIIDHLTQNDILDFCIDRCPLYLNKCFVRKAKFIAKKEAHSNQK